MRRVLTCLVVVTSCLGLTATLYLCRFWGVTERRRAFPPSVETDDRTWSLMQTCYCTSHETAPAKMQFSGIVAPSNDAKSEAPRAGPTHAPDNGFSSSGNIPLNSPLAFSSTDKETLDVLQTARSILASPTYTAVKATQSIILTAPTQERPFVRTVLGVLVPGDFFAAQTRWLHQSWQEMRKYEAPWVRTDLLIVYSAQSRPPVVDELFCSDRARVNRTEQGRCIHLRMQQVTAAIFPSIADYNYADSMIALMSTDVLRAMEKSDAVMRVDLDTFLTPAFASWMPTAVQVGRGGYNTRYALHRLRTIRAFLGLNTGGVDVVGSTWYGPVSLLADCARLTMQLMVYLKANEFTELELSPKFGTQGWPHWHFGVMLLYAGHLAINHCVPSGMVQSQPDAVDFLTTHPTATCGRHSPHKHLHAWHTPNNFSKFAFEAGKYFAVSLASLNTTLCRDYAMYMALSANKGHGRYANYTG